MTSEPQAPEFHEPLPERKSEQEETLFRIDGIPVKVSVNSFMPKGRIVFLDPLSKRVLLTVTNIRVDE